MANLPPHESEHPEEGGPHERAGEENVLLPLDLLLGGREPLRSRRRRLLRVGLDVGDGAVPAGLQDELGDPVLDRGACLERVCAGLAGRPHGDDEARGVLRVAQAVQLGDPDDGLLDVLLGGDDEERVRGEDECGSAAGGAVHHLQQEQHRRVRQAGAGHQFPGELEPAGGEGARVVGEGSVSEKKYYIIGLNYLEKFLLKYVDA